MATIFGINMKRFIAFTLAVFCTLLSTQATEKRVAILDIIDKGGILNDPIKVCIYNAISDKIANLDGYSSLSLSGVSGQAIVASERIDEHRAATLHKEHNIDLLVVVTLTYRTASKVKLNAKLIELPSGATLSKATTTSDITISQLVAASHLLVAELLPSKRFSETAYGTSFAVRKHLLLLSN